MTSEQIAILIVGVPLGYLLAAWVSALWVRNRRKAHRFWRLDK